MENFKNFFSPVHKVICPYDLTEIRYRGSIERCPSCRAELPVQYIKDYNQSPPFFTQIIGLSQVGKTTYLQSLTLALMKMGNVWGKKTYAHAPITSPTLKYVRDVRQFWSAGEMPEPTQIELDEAYIMLLNGMERWGSRILVLRDVAGEHFNAFEFPVKYTPYLLHVPTTLLMISLSDIRKKQTDSINDLMDSYIQTMMKNDKDFRNQRRNVIVVLSKADKLQEDLPANLWNYLIDDPILKAINSQTSIEMNAANMNEYMLRLKRVSGAIRDWLGKENDGQNLINRAEQNNIHLEFTLISSTGRDAENAQNGRKKVVQVEPYRVLDPFFWALEFQSR